VATIINRLLGRGRRVNNEQVQAMVQATIQAYLQQNTYVPSIAPIYPSMGQTEAIKEGYCSNADVYSIVSRKAQMASVIPFYEYEVRGKEGQKYLKKYRQLMSGEDLTMEGIYKASIYKTKALEQVADDSDLNKLLYSPNEDEGAQEMFERAYGFLELTGNAYLYKERVPEGSDQGKVLWLCTQPSNYMKIIPNGQFPLGVGGYIMTLYGQIGIEKDDIIHVKYFNPDYDVNGSQLYGLAPLYAARKTFERSNSEEDSAVAQFQHGGPAGIVSNESIDMTEAGVDQIGLLKERWDAEMQGNRNRGKVLFGAGKIDYKQTGLSPADLQLLESAQFTFRKLCRVFKMPSALFNDNEYSTQNNQQEFKKDAYVDGVLPMVIKMRDALNRSLLPDFNKKGLTYIDADFTNISALQQDMKTLSEWLNNSPEITPNERREMKMFQRLPYPYMDKPWIQKGYDTMENIVNGMDIVDPGVDALDAEGLNPYKQ